MRCTRLLLLLVLSVLRLLNLGATAQTFSVLYSFTGGSDGGRPYLGSLIRDQTGNLYGTTANGGINNYGTVFKLAPSGLLTVLHSFGGGSDGKYTFSGLIQDLNGNLYGTTTQGGRSDLGVVYRIDATGAETILYTFPRRRNGANPYAGLVINTAGVLYGTTINGGKSGGGVVFKLSTSHKETILYNFKAGSDGAMPIGGLLWTGKGVLYGTTYQGGSASCDMGCGTVFRLKGTKETVLYRFSGGIDGQAPMSSPIKDAAGNIYVTTGRGGGNSCAGGDGGCGTVASVNMLGNESPLHRFTGSDGFYPDSGVVMDSLGNLYGTTFWGGSFPGCVNNFGCGEVYKIDTTGQQTVLHNFTGGTDGGNPYAGLVLDDQGNLYGTTAYGGPNDAGIVFKLTP